MKPEASYKQIAKSTGIFGGSQLGVMLLGIVRVKFLALLLGRGGVGLAGLLQSVIDLMRSVTGLGLGFSAVKDIAEASEGNQQERIAQTMSVLNRWLWITGLGGMALTLIASPLISKIAFGSSAQILSVCLVSICVLAGSMTSGQLTILQGLRRISWMAKASLYGAFGSLLIALPLYGFLGMKGIVPAMICMSLVSLFFTTWYVHKFGIPTIKQRWRETWSVGKNMVILGLYTVAAGLIATFTLFLIRSFMLKTENLGTVGLYQAVWSISAVYVGGILTSMAADFYPKLCGLTSDNLEMTRFTNQQTRFVLIVTAPLLILLQLLATPLLQLLYSNEFYEAASLLRLQLTGTLFKVLVWPVGFILLAKGKGLRFLIVESLWYVVYYGATMLLWPKYGLNAVGIGYVVAYLVYMPAVYFLVKPLCDFQYDVGNRWMMLGYSCLTVLVLWISNSLPPIPMYICGGLLFVAAGIFSCFQLHRMIPVSAWKETITHLLKGKNHA